MAKKKTVKKEAAKKPGQPTKYKSEYDNQVLILAEKGFTDKEIADAFSVTEQTINNWKKQSEKLGENDKKKDS